MPRKSQNDPAGLPSVKLGPVHVEPALALAPMAGITSHPFRMLAREQGCGLVFSEMIHVRALLQGGRYSYLLTYFHEKERPVGLQLFGSEPALFARAARKVEALGADLVDLNLGCPAMRVVRNGEGGALLRRPQLCSDIFRAAAEAVACPVTVKMRIGWDDSLINAIEIAARAEEAGVKAITVHGRTVAQGFSGKADWGMIHEIKQAVGIPVFGNGDVATGEDAVAMLSDSGCDGLMIGRAALGNPWIFGQIRSVFEGGVAEPPTLQERVRTALRHLDLIGKFKEGETPLCEMRRHARWYLKGLPEAALARRRLGEASTVESLRRVMEEYIV